MIRALRPRRGWRAGSAALEFGLVAPVLVLVLLGLPEIAIQTLTAATLDMGVREASRFGAIGSTAPDWLPGAAPTSRVDAIRRVVLYYGGGLMRTERLTVSLSVEGVVSTATSATKTVLNGTLPDPAGGSGELVAYDVTYTQPMLPFTQMITGRTEIVHRSTTVVRNEPSAS